MPNSVNSLVVPSYAELRERTDAPPGSSWGLFGDHDEFGALNFLTPDRVRSAAASVRRGAVFNLDYPLDAFPAPVRFRPPPRHVITSLGFLPDGGFGVVQEPTPILDDYLDGFFLQGSSQIDGLRHHEHHVHGFYGGAPRASMVPGDPTIGINRWAEHGMVGRGVLIDVAAYCERQGRPLDHGASQPIGPTLLNETLANQDTELRLGDIVVIRTDYPRHLWHSPTGEHGSAGLERTYQMVGWLWDHQIPMIATDNLGVEVGRTPGAVASEFGVSFFDRLHDQLIPLLGMALGELWKLDELAADCAADGVYDFLLVAKPLNLTGGVGSPANATAIK
jgi:hypothetical protein